MELDDRLKGLIKELGDAINGALSQSVEINDAIQNIRSAGYDVFLVLEATIGFNKKTADEESADAEPVVVDARLKVTPQDLNFLRSLKISVEDLNEN